MNLPRMDHTLSTQSLLRRMFADSSFARKTKVQTSEKQSDLVYLQTLSKGTLTMKTLLIDDAHDLPLTVIIPVYNEAVTVVHLLERVLAVSYPKQVILVDDGSTDGTSELLQQWADHPDVVLLRHSHNRGKDAAIRTGLAHVGGRNAQALTRPRECGPFLRNEKIAKKSAEGLTTVADLSTITFWNREKGRESFRVKLPKGAPMLVTSVNLIRNSSHFSAPALLCSCADVLFFISFIIFDSVLLFGVTGCGGRGVQGSPRLGSLSAAGEIGDRSSLPLVSSKADGNLGRVAPGSQTSRTFWLTNRSVIPVEVAEVTSSCDCLRVELPDRLVAPGQQVAGRIELDLRKEPHFVGNLGISVEGRGKKGETVFAMTVHVTVGND
jgi:hypothetical protein